MRYAILFCAAALCRPGCVDAQSASPLPSETRAEAEAHAVRLHTRLDANHDGYTTLAEIQGSALAMVIPKGAAVPSIPESPLARKRFDSADSDHDGRLSLAEDIAGADRAFDAADTDHDGIMSGDERQAAMGATVVAEQKDIEAIAAVHGESGTR